MAERADDEWNARIWMVRAKDGREAPEPVSLTKIRRGVELGKLHVDMEIAQVDTDTWEPIAAVLARYAAARADESALFGALSSEVMTSVLPSHTEPAPWPPLPAPTSRAVPAPATALAPAAVPSPDPASAPAPAPALAAAPTAPRLEVAWSDRLERVARSTLWLSMAAAVLIVPIAYVRQRRAEAELQEELRKTKDLFAEETKERASKKVLVLKVASMGPMLSGLVKSEGHVWFTNVSPRAGVVCLLGVATNPTTQASVTSIATCHEVGAYASKVHMTMDFAGRELDEICAKVACTLAVKDAPQGAGAE